VPQVTVVRGMVPQVTVVRGITMSTITCMSMTMRMAMTTARRRAMSTRILAATGMCMA